jgi:hypothetical protein
MNSRALLVLGAILALVIAVGCSNGSRSTSPNGTLSTFNLSNDASVNRFDTTEPVVTSDDARIPWVTLRGSYSIDESGCQTLSLKERELVELSFEVSTPIQIQDGAYVEIRGFYAATPGYICNLANLFMVTQYTVLGNRHSDNIDSNTPEE